MLFLVVTLFGIDDARPPASDVVTSDPADECTFGVFTVLTQPIVEQARGDQMVGVAAGYPTNVLWTAAETLVTVAMVFALATFACLPVLRHHLVLFAVLGCVMALANV